MSLEMDLAVIMLVIVAFSVFVYVVMDGFDLGLAMLFPLFPDRQDRDVMMNSVAPVWDGNETWLVLGGGAVFAAFPLAYAILMPALYAPIIAMLLGLVFRGVAFEFRWRTERGRFLWDFSFAWGSLIAALAQGIALGAILQGIEVDGRAYGGGWWDWLTPFSLLTGVAVVIGYCLLGATWLVMKTSGSLQDRAYRYAFLFAVAMLVCIGAVSLATPFLDGEYWLRWFELPRLFVSAPVPVAVVIVAVLLFRSIAARHEAWPFVLSLLLFALSFVGLGVSVFPHIVPTSVTIWEAAAPEKSLVFILVGVSIMIPIILAYTAYTYWVFRGKIDPDDGYH